MECEDIYPGNSGGPMAPRHARSGKASDEGAIYGLVLSQSESCRHPNVLGIADVNVVAASSSGSRQKRKFATRDLRAGL